MTKNRWIAGWVWGLSLACIVGGYAHAASAKPLKVCADPNYMPYSNRLGQGFENKMAQLVGSALGRPVEYVWSSYRQPGGFDNFLALNLDKHRCDVIMDIPYGDVEETFTDSYYGSSYVFVYKKSKQYDLSEGMDSPILKHIKIGFEQGTPPEAGLKMRGLALSAHAFDTAEKSSISPEAPLRAVADGKVDVMITWEPAVGYFIQKDFPGLTMAPVPSTNSLGTPERYMFFMAMAVAPGEKELKRQLNQVIKTHKAQIEQILTSYNVRMLH